MYCMGSAFQFQTVIADLLDTMQAGAAAGILRTAAQEHSSKAWHSMDCSPASQSEGVVTTEDAYGAHLEGGLLQRPQLLSRSRKTASSHPLTGNTSLLHLKMK